MLKVSVISVVVVIFLTVCFWLNRKKKLYEKLYYEEKVKNIHLIELNGYYQEKISQLEFKKQQNDSISLDELEEVDSLPYWEDECEKTVDSYPWKDEDGEVIFTDSPFVEFEQTLDDDPLESFKKFAGYYPGEQPLQQNNYAKSMESFKDKQDFYPWEYGEVVNSLDNPLENSERVLYDDPLKDFRAQHGFYPWEWDELKKETNNPDNE
ncbi:hypothetical protein [Cytobacillus kochii]|uniref:hypothetical protein n=1 Tax=Cytobacillus kochii TaxID=859143 RepID=UPI0024818AD3|nr:hypothetical protein [Cytobacillus kochii]